jgi:hypothetical protein
MLIFLTIWGAVVATVGLVMAFARTGPDEAASNLSKWAEKVGLHNAPRWLRSKAADRLVLRWGKVVLVLLALVGFCAGGILFFREQDDLEWAANESAYGLEVEGQREKADGPFIPAIYGFTFNGRNISDRPIYQIDSFITVDRTKEVIPLYIASGGQWHPLRDIDGIPPHFRFTIGCQMRSDPFHCGNFIRQMTVDRFFVDIGAFTFTFNFDRKRHVQHFSVSDLERQIEEVRQRIERAAPKSEPEVQLRK